jgi:hypothetical protein
MALTQPAIGSTNWGTAVNINWATLDNIVAKQFVHVTRNNTSQTGIVTGTDTKVQYTTKVFDAANIFDNTTNYRATPTIAGKYLVIAAAGFLNLVAADLTRSRIFKNGSQDEVFGQANNGTSNENVITTAIVDMNGTTDYLEHFIFHNAGANRSTIDSDFSLYFQIMRITE